VEKESPSAIDEFAREETMRAFVGPSEAIQRVNDPQDPEKFERAISMAI
jgi:hypothetical protein